MCAIYGFVFFAHALHARYTVYRRQIFVMATSMVTDLRHAVNFRSAVEGQSTHCSAASTSL